MDAKHLTIRPLLEAHLPRCVVAASSQIDPERSFQKPCLDTWFRLEDYVRWGGVRAPSWTLEVGYAALASNATRRHSGRTRSTTPSCRT
jgi:hypothetical protein